MATYLFTPSSGPRAADDQHDQEARLRDALDSLAPQAPAPGPIHVIHAPTPGSSGDGGAFERLRGLVETGQVDVLAIESADHRWCNVTSVNCSWMEQSAEAVGRGGAPTGGLSRLAT